MEKLGKRHITPSGALKASWKYGSFVYVFLFMFIVYLLMLNSKSSISLNKIGNILTHTVPVGVVALGMGMIIISGEIDLSVGSTMAFSGAMGILGYNKVFEMTQNAGAAIGTAIAIIISISTIIGFINGFMVGKMKIPAFIATLGTMLIFRSLCQFVLKELPSKGGSQQQMYAITNFFSTGLFNNFGDFKIGFISITGIIFIVLTLGVWYLTKYTKFGRRIYALGSNKKAASLAGINVEWTKVAIFSLAGTLVGIAGFLWVAKEGSVDSSTCGQQYELFAIASCVIGGISMTGGKGNIIGIIFGGMAFEIIGKIISVAELNPLINNTIKGCILLLAVILQVVVVNKQAFIGRLQELGIIFNPKVADNLESKERKILTRVDDKFAKQIRKVVTSNLSEDEKQRRIDEILAKKASKVEAIESKYAILIDDANMKVAEYNRRQALKQQREDAKDVLSEYKRELKHHQKMFIKSNPKYIRAQLDHQIKCINAYYDKSDELISDYREKMLDDSLLKTNAEHKLERDLDRVANAQAKYEKRLEEIEKEVSTNEAKVNKLIEKYSTRKEKQINKLEAKIAANEPHEEAQYKAYEVASAKLAAKAEKLANKKAVEEQKAADKVEAQRRENEIDEYVLSITNPEEALTNEELVTEESVTTTKEIPTIDEIEVIPEVTTENTIDEIIDIESETSEETIDESVLSEELIRKLVRDSFETEMASLGYRRK